MIDPIDMLATRHEADLEQAITDAVDQAIASFDLGLIEAVLTNAEEPSSADDYGQLVIAMGVDPGSDPIADAFEQSAYITGGLASLFVAIAALAASQARHTINANDTRVSQARDDAMNSFRGAFLAESLQALREIADHMLHAPGDPRSRALQIRRTIGLTVNQSNALRAMRAALHAFATASSVTTRARTINGVHTPAQTVRDVDAAAILRGLQGKLSTPQINLVRKAFADNIDVAEAERRLDRHATALRIYRAKSVAGETVHQFVETAKLAGWQIAQRFGALPAGQRRYWQTAGDERVRHAHAQVPGMNAQGVALDQPFNTPLGPRMTPPLEYGCRCKVRLKAA